MSALKPIMAKGAAASLPLDLILDTIPSLPRPLLARMVAKIIDRLDEMDGDSDVELNGDELDGSRGEDDFGILPNWILGPGCPIADGGV